MPFRLLQPGKQAPDIYIANADGSNARLLVTRAAMPTWSPDGQSIAFANLRSGERGISVVEVKQALRGRALVEVITRTSDAIPEEDPAWSPDGGRIAFTSHRDGSSDIWIVDAGGGEPRQLTDEPSLDNSAAWSPNGKLIAFGSNRDADSYAEGGDIYLMKPDGTEVQRVTDDQASFAPAWSPDGCMIAFNTPSGIRVIGSDGRNGRPVTPRLVDSNGEPAAMCCVSWRPRADF